MDEFFGNIADWIVKNISSQKVLDVGCAKGFLVECFGIDISKYAISQVREDIKPYCKVSSILDPFPEKYYDPIVCIEISEHLPEEDVRKAIKNLCKHTDDIIFSSTPSDFHEPTHLNVQPAEYWIRLFSECGFYRDVFFDGSFISPVL